MFATLLERKLIGVEWKEGGSPGRPPMRRFKIPIKCTIVIIIIIIKIL